MLIALPVVGQGPRTPLPPASPATSAPTSAETTKIQWTAIADISGNPVPGHSFNAWEGCVKVSPGCQNCYAEAQHSFYYSSLKGEGLPGTCWGINAPRLARQDDYWRKPLRWNRLAATAQAAGREINRRRVFSNSMADVFEEQSEKSRRFAVDGTTAQVPRGNGKFRTVHFADISRTRQRLFKLIFDTPNLDWLLLTKRPENIVPMLREAADNALFTAAGAGKWGAFHTWLRQWVNGCPPQNVWLGTSIENQAQVQPRLTALLAAPAVRYFVSMEPLLEAVTVFDGPTLASGVFDKLDWIIVGGESGVGSRVRPQEYAWAFDLRNQAWSAGVDFLFKQMGTVWAKAAGSADRHGGNLNDVPAELRVRESPKSYFGKSTHP